MFTVQLQKYASDKYEERKKYYGCLLADIEEGLKGCQEEEAVLMRFLYGTMPLRDAGEYEFNVFLSFVQHALWLRREREWCRKLPEEIFIHYVLYYRINSESISDCRNFFYEQLKDRIEGLDLKAAILEINYWCAENAAYEATDERTVSPMTMYRCKRGRCGEESTFVVTAYRSMGIPARQIYTPRWAHCDDNHAWVEVYLEGSWYFLGACEPEEALNRGWFTQAANRAILIHSRRFSDFPAASLEETLGQEGVLTYCSHTSYYARTEEVAVLVKDARGNPVEGAQVILEILNMAEYFPSAVLITDRNGEVRIKAGLGDIRVRAFKGEAFGERKLTVSKGVKEELLLHTRNDNIFSDRWEQDEYLSPVEHPLHSAYESKEQKEKNAERLKAAREIRERSLAACYDEEIEKLYQEDREAIRRAGANAEEIKAFLTRDENPLRKQLLLSLSEKDFKDLKAEILEDHLEPYNESYEFSRDIYCRYVLCPRIFREELTPYKSFIRNYFSKEEKEGFAGEPDLIWKYIKTVIGYIPEEEYDTLCATPVGSLRLGLGSPLAKSILFAAICRSLHIPARLNPVTHAPEYFRDGLFVSPEADTLLSTATLVLKKKKDSRWSYYQNWTIGKLKGVQFKTLVYEGKVFGEKELKLELEEGIYRIVATRRMPEGHQKVYERVFRLVGRERKVIEMAEWDTDRLIPEKSVKLENFLFYNSRGKESSLLKLVKQKPVILAFLGTGEEPTEHVLNELLDIADTWNSSGGRMLVVLREQLEMENITLGKVLAKLSGIEIYYDNSGCCSRAAAKLRLNEDKLPVLILADSRGNSMYACGGYHVGSVEFMLKLLEEQNCKEDKV